ncbi:Actin cross-linking [Parasponia andersonii]|uniref:Actin cross-linking n=1 Tax=Parasponia andersonii TaxID=3476 RepID=A0A2P5D2E8_PARAD|nr:Actin cross-linking [Parasponia andersonii]
MEFFNKAKAVKLRSHLDKYLVADDDLETVRQSRNGSSRKAKWIVEFVENKSHAIRLKSCHGHYLTASDVPFLLGMTGNKVFQTEAERDKNDCVRSDWKYDWEPIRDGFQVKLRSWCGKFLRANGGTPPWRNSITHDDPHTASTQNWILWDVEEVELTESESVADYLSSLSGVSSVSDDVLSELGSPRPVVSARSSFKSPRFSFKSLKKESNKFNNSFKSGMDLFHNAKAVRLKSHHDKYLTAEEDEESVTQDRNGSSKNARWTVEFVPGSESIIRLKSTYGKYLTASNQPFLLGMTGRKVVQTLPRRLDSSLEWEPIREGNHVRLKTRYGHFLRANGGLPPWRNSVTHDIPHRTSTQDWILWDVDILEIEVLSPGQKPSAPAVPHSDSLDFESSSPSSVSIKSGNFSRQESSDSYVGSPPKLDGRTIYYHIADENGEVDDESVEGYSFTFRGNGVEELTRKFEEETGIEGIIMCSRSPLNGKLYPLRLQLPPNNVTMHVVVVLSQSKGALS